MKQFWLGLCLFCVLILPLHAQVQMQAVNPCIKQGCYYATTSASIANTASTTLTIQQPAAGARAVSFSRVVAQCAGVTFSVAQAQNGTAATTTAGSAVALMPTAIAANALVYTASNVGAGTATSPVLNYASGGTADLDLSPLAMIVAGTANNFSVKVTNTGGAGSCTAVIGIYWTEKI